MIFFLKGASIGMIVAHIVTFILTIGSFTIDKTPVKYLPTSTAGCNNHSFSSMIYDNHGMFNISQLSTVTNIYNETSEYDYDTPPGSGKLDLEITPATQSE